MLLDLESQYLWHHILILSSLAYVNWPITWWHFGFEGGVNAMLRNNCNDQVAFELIVNYETSTLIVSTCEYDYD